MDALNKKNTNTIEPHRPPEKTRLPLYLGQESNAAQEHWILLLPHHGTEEIHGGLWGERWGQESKCVLRCLTDLTGEGERERERIRKCMNMKNMYIE